MQLPFCSAWARKSPWTTRSASQTSWPLCRYSARTTCGITLTWAWGQIYRFVYFADFFTFCCFFLFRFFLAFFFLTLQRTNKSHSTNYFPFNFYIYFYGLKVQNTKIHLIPQDILAPDQYEGLYGQGPPSVHSSHGGRAFQQGKGTKLTLVTNPRAVTQKSKFY